MFLQLEGGRAAARAAGAKGGGATLVTLAVALGAYLMWHRYVTTRGGIHARVISHA